MLAALRVMERNPVDSAATGVLEEKAAEPRERVRVRLAGQRRLSREGQNGEEPEIRGEEIPPGLVKKG